MIRTMEPSIASLSDLNENLIARLKTAVDISSKVHVSAERLLCLAEAFLIPHWRIDGQPRFELGKTKKWVAENLSKSVDGVTLPIEMRPILVFDRCTANSRPTALKAINRLISMESAVYPCGVYFLCQGDDVVYVGQATSPARRVASHYEDGKVFDRVFMIPVPIESLIQVEGAFIRMLKPPLNGGKNRLKSDHLTCAGGNPQLDSGVLLKLLDQSANEYATARPCSP